MMAPRNAARRRFESAIVEREEWLHAHLPYVRVLRDDVILCRGGEVIGTLAVEGLPGDTRSDAELDGLAVGLSTVIAQAGVDIGFYVHRLTGRSAISLPPVEDGGFAQAVDERWLAALQRWDLLRRRLYVTVVARPGGLKWSWRARPMEDLQRRWARTAERLDEVLGWLAPALSVVQPRRLRVSDGEWLGFLAALTSGRFQSLRPSPIVQPLGYALTEHRAVFRGGELDLVGLDEVHSRAAAILSLKAYPKETWAGVLDGLDGAEDLVVTQSYTPIDPLQASDKIRTVRRQMRAVDDDAKSLEAQLEEAADLAAQRAISLGHHHCTIMVLGPDQAAVRASVARLRNVLDGTGGTGIREEFAAVAGYFAQHPGNSAYRARASLISGLNFCHLAALHAAPAGPGADETPWGAPLTVMPTVSGDAYRVSLHERGSPSERTAGHTLVLGRPGTGKTFLAAFLMAQSRRVGVRLIVFDKDRGLEMPLRALGGTYTAVRLGEATALNPCATEIDDRGVGWLGEWLELLAGHELSPAQSAAVATAASENRRVPEHLRHFEALRGQFRSIEDGRDLYDRLGEWDEGGRYGWVFSGRGPDGLALDADVVGFDLSELFEVPRVRTAWLAYVFRRVERLVEDHRPTLIVLDEAWQLLDDPFFERRLRDWTLTLRKRNAAVMLLTQQPQHVLESRAGAAIIESAVTQILFRTSRGDRNAFARLGLNAAELDWVTDPRPARRVALLRRPEESVLLDVDLKVLGGLVAPLGSLKEGEPVVGDDWRERERFWEAAL